MKLLKHIAIFPFVVLIRIYQYIISPVIGPKCRFIPSCSQYAIEALKKYGVYKGVILSIKRLSQCRPGGKSGYDPIP